MMVQGLEVETLGPCRGDTLDHSVQVAGGTASGGSEQRWIMAMQQGLVYIVENGKSFSSKTTFNKEIYKNQQAAF